jgi:hypothetical protein
MNPQAIGEDFSVEKRSIGYYRMTPKKDSPLFTRVNVILNSDRWVQTIEMIENNGDRTTIHFSQTQWVK